MCLYREEGKGRVDTSVRKIGKSSTLPVNHAQKAVTRLIKAGLIERIFKSKSHNQASVYRLNPIPKPPKP